MILQHFVSKGNIKTLQQVFAVLTPVGWQTPAWLRLLQQTAFTDHELQLTREQWRRRDA